MQRTLQDLENYGIDEINQKNQREKKREAMDGLQENCLINIIVLWPNNLRKKFKNCWVEARLDNFEDFVWHQPSFFGQIPNIIRIWEHLQNVFLGVALSPSFQYLDPLYRSCAR
jgi:hypothetical protein